MSFAPTGIDRTRAGLWLCFAVLVVGSLFVVWQFVGTLVLGLFAYYVARPVFSRIERRLPSRTLAAAATLVVVVLPVLVLVGWTVTLAARELAAVVGDGLPEQVTTILEPYVGASVTVDSLEETVRTVLADPSQFDRLNQSVVTVLEAAGAALVSLLTALVHLFIVLVVAFYLLRDDHRIASWARETIHTTDGVVGSYLRAVDSDLQSVFFGNILNALLTGILGVVTYGALDLVAPAGLGLPNPVLLGLLSGVASLVPVIGIKLVWVPVGGYLLVQSALVDPATAWFVAVFASVSVVVVDTIPDQLLRPYVSGRTLHVGAVMLAYTVGPLLFGWYGIFLGPLLLVVAVEFARHVIPWLADPGWQPPGTTEPAFAADSPSTTQPTLAEAVAGASAESDSTPTATDDGETRAVEDTGADG